MPRRKEKISFEIREEIGIWTPFSISLVPASKCDVCGETMIAHDHLHWRCENEDCEAKGVPVETGVYPLSQLGEPDGPEEDR